MKKLLEKNKAKKELTAELHKLGIKTYRKKSTAETFVKRGDVKKVLKKATAASLSKNEQMLVTSVTWLKKSINGDKMKKLLEKSKVKNKKILTAELHKLGIKTYRKKSTAETFVKRGEVKKVLARLGIQKHSKSNA